ncbi:hypothetical protein SVA_1168 [Sulfurifustis variabilis]|uniref:Uncharacterized protein n=1 Tax=Sulfurifustis variabilis TaxID=1675686 RepID=A0A1B4V2J3_9GAMM|nr:hypothetical protein [Sulfurifustis variabilis]BAU47743.1 hypothetical protein SVA_1168 [Sulfurifustis variabilis]
MAEDKNQGEGNREAARHYNEEARKFAQSGRVEEAAREAKPDPQAEEAAGARAKEHDPEEKRDYEKPEK